jgi:hypothetical protein
LNRDARAGISAELRANLALSGETAAQVADALGVSDKELKVVLGVNGADAVLIWKTRAYLETAVRDLGLTPHRYSTPDPQAHVPATRWFGLTLKPPR